MPFNKPDITQLSALGNTVGDVYFPQTKLLLPFDGTNGATSTTDSSNSNHTVTFNGTAQISTAQSKFGGSSILFDGDSDYLNIPDSSNFDFGAAAFTVECWINFTTSTGSSYPGLVVRGRGGGGGNSSWWFGLHENKVSTWLSTSGSGWATSSDDTGPALNDGAWHHLAWVGDGTNVKGYVDGTLCFTITQGTLYNSNRTVDIGSVRDGNETYAVGNCFGGYMDGLRITKGVARYTSAFTPLTTAHSTSAGDVNKQILINSTADGVAIGTAGINQARIAKAWCNFDGTGTPAIRGSYNCSSITDMGTGSYKVNFSTGMSDEGNYVAFCAGAEVNSGSVQNHLFHLKRETPDSDILNENFVHVASANTIHTQTDDGLFCVLVFGN
ncbi:MAG: LamG domain-containing protein [Anaerolineales bacterium]|nr:LamG domain-containing protein [Anaerolineales bacterium]